MDSRLAIFSSETMNEPKPMAAEVLEISAAGFASAADAHLQRTRPDVARGGSMAWRTYFRQRLLELAAALRVGDPTLFVRRIEWLRRAAEARTGSDSSVEPALRSLAAALRAEAPATLHGSIATVLDAALDSLGTPLAPEPSALDAEDPHGRLALEFVTLCLEGDTAGAANAITGAAEAGTPPQDLYCRVLLPARKEVGRLWHRGDLSVAEERLVSETTRRVMAQLSARYQPARPSGSKVLAASVAGNAHDLGLRAAADLLTLAGWRCLYLGANVPTADIAAMAEAQGVELVLLAATLETHLSATADVIAEIKRKAPACKTLLGGIDVGDATGLLRELGADAHCARLEDVVSIADSLVRAARH
jgi:methanogenic corrinoid protein MtbC1